MTNNEIVERINRVLAVEFELDPDVMRPSASFKDDLGLDSLDAVDMVVVLEQEFKFKITKTESFQNIRTLGDLHAYILARWAEASAAQGCAA